MTDEEYKGPGELANTVGKALTWNILPIAADVIGYQTGSRTLMGLSGIGHIVALVGGGMSGYHQAAAARRQHNRLLETTSKLTAENEALRAQLSWVEKTGGKPSELIARSLAEEKSQPSPRSR